MVVSCIAFVEVGGCTFPAGCFGLFIALVSWFNELPRFYLASVCLMRALHCCMGFRGWDNSTISQCFTSVFGLARSLVALGGRALARGLATLWPGTPRGDLWIGA